ncbi:MAG TPA: ABC-F family ATP-binding cassette domain-containing protein [Chthoniobacterales bacterium]
MLTVDGVSKRFGAQLLFEGISFQIGARDRVGLVGPNGAGKSTLLEIIAGQVEPDQGRISFSRGFTIGYLPQESSPAGDESVLALALGRFESVSQAASTDNLIADPTDPAVEAGAKRVLRGLGFLDTDFERSARELSGGWVMRTHLARLLVSKPDLLLLDEPTNHLDIDSVAWLTQYLRESRSALVMISHDRTFLNRLASRILELDRGTLSQYPGNYDRYLELKKAREEQLVAAYRNQEREIGRLQEFVDRFGAKATKAAQAQSKLKQIERLRQLEAPDLRRSRVSFKFPQPPRSGAEVMRLTQATFAYGERVICRGLDLQVERGQRLAILGANGTGKSTLLRLLAGLLPLASGERRTGHNVELSYFSQQRMEMFQPARTVLEEALELPVSVGEQMARSVLGAFLFRGDDVFKPVAALSGGEKSRLALAKLLLNPPNFMLLDEPTTHLDLQSVEALVGALKQYHGTLVFVSHDLYLIQELATSILYLDRQGARFYPGDLNYFQDRRAADLALSPEPAVQESFSLPANRPSRDLQRERKRQEANARQERSRERKALEAQLAEVEAQVLRLEKEQKGLIDRLQATDAAQASMDLRRVTSALEELTARWEQLAETLHATG